MVGLLLVHLTRVLSLVRAVVVGSLELSLAHASVIMEAVATIIRVVSYRAGLRTIRIKQLCRLWWPTVNVVLSRPATGATHHVLRREAWYRSLVH